MAMEDEGETPTPVELPAEPAEVPAEPPAEIPLEDPPPETEPTPVEDPPVEPAPEGAPEPPEIEPEPPLELKSAPAQPPLITPQPQQPREKKPAVAPVPPKPPFRFWRTVRRATAMLLVFLLVAPPVAVAAYRVIPPPLTWLMIERLFQGYGLHKKWVSLGDIDPSLPNAVIAAEDARFCEHHGFDFEAMQKAMRANERHPGKLRGGSTISQQVAKNVFLWPGRDYVRKGFEAYFTVLIEAVWGKRRIMEMYLNVVEWGPGAYGAEAAAQRYFAEDAEDIDPGEAARLAAILPSPLKWKAVNPGAYVQKRSRHIGAAAGTVRRDGLARCLR